MRKTTRGRFVQKVQKVDSKGKPIPGRFKFIEHKPAPESGKIKLS